MFRLSSIRLVVDMSKTKKLNKSQIKYLLSILLMAGVTILAIYYVLNQGDATQTITALGESKSAYVFTMGAIAILSFVLEGWALTVLARLYKRKYLLYQGVLNGMIGSFFSAITPFASGGQFVQAFTFSKQGVKAADSASILVMLFIVSQSVVVVYGTLAIIFGYESTILHMQDINLFGWKISPILFSFIGYAINIFSLGFLLLMSYCRPIHRFILNSVIGIGAKLHLIKDPDRKKASLAAQVATFRIELGRLFKNWWVMFLLLIIEFLKFTCYNLYPYFAGLALGADMKGLFWKCLWSNSYLSMITCFIPLPGASGGAEAGFQALFSSIYPSTEITSAANLLCRAVSFYFSLILGFMVFIFYRGSPKKEAYSYDNRKTFVDLQIISLAQDDPRLREVTIVPPDENIDETQTGTNAALSPSKVKEAMQEEQVVKKKKRIWPWSKKAKGNSLTENNLFMTPEQISRSFEEIKQTLILNQKDIYAEENEYASSSKESLKKVYSEVQKKEEENGEDNKTDTEIELAIQKDLDALKAESEKKAKKRRAREEKRQARFDAFKQKHAKDHKDE
jgi:uncharacterized protein (TIRG00374 family)